MVDINPCAQNTRGVNVPHPERLGEREGGGGKEGSALAHDSELCSVCLADRTAEDLELQCSISLGDALSEMRKRDI